MSDSPKTDSRRGSLGPAPIKFGANFEQGGIKFYNCAPVKQRKGSLTPADDKDIKLDKDEVFGIACDEDNKIHYYNCAPIKQKKAKKSPPAPQPMKKMFNRIFKGESGTPSGSDLSLSSIGSNGSAKNT